MRILGIILIIIGLLMVIYNGFNIKTQKQVAKVGPLEINKTETKHIGWPMLAGGIVAVAGGIIVFAGRNKGKNS